MKWKLIILVLIFIAFYFLEKEKSNNFLVFCNVGQGDGALLVVEGVNVLMDTGPGNKQILKCMEKYLPFWNKQIDLIMISHWDSDHSGGLSDILKYYEVNNIFCADYESENVEQKNCSKKLKSGEMVRVGLFNFEILSSGLKLENGETRKVDDNENSLVTLLTYKDNKFLFTGDIIKENEERLVWRKILQSRINILKVSHHGSGSATSETLLKEIKAEVAVVSVGKNSFGHPDKGTLLRLNNYGVKVLRTDRDGDIKINLN